MTVHIDNSTKSA